jgi:hypothetical protein
MRYCIQVGSASKEKIQCLRAGGAGSTSEQFQALNFPRFFGQTNKWPVMDSGSANGGLQEGVTVYYGLMVKVTLPERFGPPHHLKGHREPQQEREGKQKSHHEVRVY